MFSLSLSLSLIKWLIPKTIGNRKRDWAWGCARGINTTWENLQNEKHKSVRWAERSPSWFVLFDLLSFSSGVYPPSTTSRTISFFLFPIVFGIELIHVSMRRRTVQPEIRSFVSVLRSPVTPFDKSKTKNENCFEECNVFGNGKCELNAIKEGGKRCNFLARNVQNSSPILRCTFLARKGAKLIANFRATKVTSLPSISLSLSLSLSVSLSLSEHTSRTM